MKSVLTRAVLGFGAAFMLVVIASAEQLKGNIGSAAGSNWQSSWIDLASRTDFKRGERLKLVVRGNAENVVIRLLPQGSHPTTPDGILGDVMKVPKGGVLEVALNEDRRNVVQVSVHAGPNAWNISLGDKNGHVTLTSVERTPR